jgi:hypothetical protein
MRAVCTLVAIAVVRWAAPAWFGQQAEAWYRGDEEHVRALAAEQVRFEAEDSALRSRDPDNRYVGEWALVTHQMTALGLGQMILAHPAWKSAYATTMREAALRSFLPEMRDFGTDAWHGEDALASLESAHGHAYLGYAALAIGMARWLDPEDFPADVSRAHDALVAAYERRLLASPIAVIETYPGEAYPTDIAAVAAAIAVHGRATGTDHRAVLAHWVRGVRTEQRDASSGFVHQRLTMAGEPLDVPRGSGTGLAAYYASFVDRALAAELTDALIDHERTCGGFGGIAELPIRTERVTSTRARSCSGCRSRRPASPSAHSVQTARRVGRPRSYESSAPRSCSGCQPRAAERCDFVAGARLATRSCSPC